MREQLPAAAQLTTVEANFDGLVGPTHHYAGLAFGNLASARNAEQPSNPRAAVRQGIAKMRALAAMGLAQGVLPPQERPHLPTLRALGFGGSDADMLGKAARQAPQLLSAASSASAMWTANAATVSPSADCADGRVHFTPANLVTHLHRAIEAPQTARILRSVFADPRHFAHHAPLPATPMLGDEGAANHTRFCSDYGDTGLELFVYGRDARDPGTATQLPARQTRLASEAVARLHGLNPARSFFARQHPAAIDAGAFHNDVIAVGNRELLLYHEQAFADAPALRAWLCTHLPGPHRPVFVEIGAAELTLAQAVDAYLFNSQLLTLADGSQRLIAAQECREIPAAWQAIQRLIADPHNPLSSVETFDLRQSMRNGGGPACLRLRVVLRPAERLAVTPGCWIDAARAAELEQWADAHYRDRLLPSELADPQLLDESRRALDRLSTLLGLGSVYDFQRTSSVTPCD